MRWDGNRESDNVEDARDVGGGGGFRSKRLAAAMATMLTTTAAATPASRLFCVGTSPDGGVWPRSLATRAE